MTNARTPLTPVTLTTPAPGPVTLTGHGALRLVTPPTGHPVVRPPDRVTGQPVTRGAVTLTGHPDPTPPDRSPGQPVSPVDPTTLTAPTPPAPPATWSPGHPVTRSPGQPDQPAGTNPIRRLFGRSKPKHAANSEPTTETAPAAKRKPDPLPRWLNNVWLAVVWAVTAAATYLAYAGQYTAADTMEIENPKRAIVPIGLELVAVAFVLTGYVVARLGFSPWPAWFCAAGVGGFAVYNVLEHSPTTAQGQLFAAFTCAALLLWFVKLLYSLKRFRRESNQAAGNALGFGRLWLDDWRLTRHAAKIGRRFQINDVDEAVLLAEVFVAVLDDARDANAQARAAAGAATKAAKKATTPEDRDKARDEAKAATEKIMARKLRKRMAWRAVQKAAGRPVAELPSFADVERISMRQAPPADPDPKPKPEPAPAPETVDEVARRWAAEQAQLAAVETPQPVAAPRAPQRRTPDQRSRPAAAPVSPAVGGVDPYQPYANAISQVQAAIPEWKTRPAKISAGEVGKVDPVAADGVTKITGKPTWIKISWLIETLSNRAHEVPDDVYTRYGIPRERKAATS